MTMILLRMYFTDGTDGNTGDNDADGNITNGGTPDNTDAGNEDNEETSAHFQEGATDGVRMLMILTILMMRYSLLLIIPVLLQLV